MTAPTTIEFKVTADTSQAQAAVGGLEDKFQKSTGAVNALDKRIEALTADMHELSTAIAKGGSNADAYRAELQRLERQMNALDGSTGAAAASIGHVDAGMHSAAKSTRNAGQATLEASRAFEDLQYGVGGVINNIPSLLQSLGVGAGLTGVLAAGTVVAFKAGEAIVGLYQEMEEANRINKEWDKGLEKVTGRLRDRFTAAVDDAKTAVRDAAKELRRFGMDSNESRAADIRDSIEFQRSRIATIDAGMPERQKRIAKAQSLLEAEQRRQIKLTADERFRLKDQIAVENVVIKESTKTREAAISSIKEEEKALKSIEEIKTQTDKKEKERDAADKAERDAERSRAKERENEEKARFDVYLAGLDAEDKALAEVKKQRMARAKKDAEEEAKAARDAIRLFDKERKDAETARAREQARAAADAKRLAERGVRRQSSIEGTNLGDRLAYGSLQRTDPEVARINELSDHEFDALKMRRDNWAGFYEDIGALGSEMFGGLIAESATLFNALAAGEEKAVETFAVNVMKNAGQSLVGSGTKLAGEAVVSALTPGLQPLAAAQLAGAVGLVGAGVSLGAGAGALGSILGLGKGGDKIAARDPGASPRTTGDGGGTGLVVNIAYGVTGPLPEDTAREVRAALAVEGRR